MTTRLGTVLVFKPEATKEQVTKALESIRDVLAEDYFVQYTPLAQPKYTKVPFNLHEYNPEWGGPTWYIP